MRPFDDRHSVPEPARDNRDASLSGGSGSLDPADSRHLSPPKLPYNATLDERFGALGIDHEVTFTDEELRVATDELSKLRASLENFGGDGAVSGPPKTQRLRTFGPLRELDGNLLHGFEVVRRGSRPGESFMMEYLVPQFAESRFAGQDGSDAVAGRGFACSGPEVFRLGPVRILHRISDNGVSTSTELQMTPESLGEAVKHLEGWTHDEAPREAKPYCHFAAVIEKEILIAERANVIEQIVAQYDDFADKDVESRLDDLCKSGQIYFFSARKIESVDTDINGDHLDVSESERVGRYIIQAFYTAPVSMGDALGQGSEQRLKGILCVLELDGSGILKTQTIAQREFGSPENFDDAKERLTQGELAEAVRVLCSAVNSKSKVDKKKVEGILKSVLMDHVWKQVRNEIRHQLKNERSFFDESEVTFHVEALRKKGEIKLTGLRSVVSIADSHADDITAIEASRLEGVHLLEAKVEFPNSLIHSPGGGIAERNMTFMVRLDEVECLQVDLLKGK